MDNTTSKVNWKVRWSNKLWVAGFFAQTLLMIQGIIFALEGLQVIDIDLEKIDAWARGITAIVDLILAYLSYLGIVIDPTVEGLGDSKRALKRDKPLPEELKNNNNFI